MTQRQIERALLLAGDTPGVILRSTLAPGEGQGAAILSSRPNTSRSAPPCHSITRCRRRWGRPCGASDSISTVWLDWASSFTCAPTVIRKTATSSAPIRATARWPPARVVPLWIDGLSFNPEYTQARTTPLPQNNVATTDTFERMSLRVRYSWLRSRMLNYSQELSFDAQDETNSLFVGTDPVPLSRDRLRIFRFTQDADYFTPLGRDTERTAQGVLWRQRARRARARSGDALAAIVAPWGRRAIPEAGRLTQL